MSTITATFRVDPRITEVLGESYRSSEQALKELVDNAWDAEATWVAITLPEPLSWEPVIVEDNGAGMTAAELQVDYLRVGRNRRATRGERTPTRHRLVKGRKGVGKFAGLMVADRMEVLTKARGGTAMFQLRRSELMRSAGDFEEIRIAIEEGNAAPGETGTRVTLRDLHQNLAFPNAEKLRAMLIRDYGREEDFEIVVNRQVASFEDLPGQTFELPLSASHEARATLYFTVVEGRRKVPDAGIAVRWNGKLVGTPQFFGVEAHEELPRTVLGRIYGALVVKGADPHAITADGGSFVENNRTYQALAAETAGLLAKGLRAACRLEMQAARGRGERLISERVASLPEERREFAEETLRRLMERFYPENEERFEAILSVLLEALALR